MSEEFIKENDHTLAVVNEETVNHRNISSGGKWGTSLKKTFNFESAQVTTLYREWIYYGSGYHDASAALTSQMHIQNFSDFDSKAEIERMRAKLKELGGNPPDGPHLDKRDRNPTLS
jgi:hypothetical protein